MNSAIRARREAEDGFTLIELLVVVIIIGILAAIAIPAFLNQRERAWQAELTSAVRNAALEIEAEGTQNGGAYPVDADGQASVDAFLTGQFNNDMDNDGTVELGEPVTIDYASAGTNQFVLCGTTALITSTANRVVYLGGTAGSGLQGYEEVACP